MRAFILAVALFVCSFCVSCERAAEVALREKAETLTAELIEAETELARNVARNERLQKEFEVL